MSKFDSKLTRRVAWGLLLSLWFQMGVALGSVISSDNEGAFAAFCRNGSLAFVSELDTEIGDSHKVVCPVCAKHSDDHALQPSQDFANPTTHFSARSALSNDSWLSSGSALTPPARGPPLYL